MASVRLRRLRRRVLEEKARADRTVESEEREGWGEVLTPSGRRPARGGMTAIAVAALVESNARGMPAPDWISEVVAMDE